MKRTEHQDGTADDDLQRQHQLQLMLDEARAASATGRADRLLTWTGFRCALARAALDGFVHHPARRRHWSGTVTETFVIREAFALNAAQMAEHTDEHWALEVAAPYSSEADALRHVWPSPVPPPDAEAVAVAEVGRAAPAGADLFREGCG